MAAAKKTEKKGTSSGKNDVSAILWAGVVFSGDPGKKKKGRVLSAYLKKKKQ